MISSNRIAKICSLVKNRIVVDVGSDHGFTVKNLFNDHKIDFAFVTDISKKCVEKAQSNLQDFQNQIRFLCGDGLAVFQNSQAGNLGAKHLFLLPKDVIITGMGGEEIKKILIHPVAKNFESFVLGPQKNVADLRRFCVANNLLIVDEKLAKDDKMFYNLMRVERVAVATPLSEKQILFGAKIDFLSKEFVEFAHFKLEKFESLLRSCEVKSVRREYELLKEILGGNLC